MQEQDWKLPFFVEWRTPGNGDDRVFGVLRPALSLYPTQLLTIQRLLGSYTLEDRNDRWILPKAVVHAMLIKAQGITPEFNYKWMEEGCPAVPAPPAVIYTESKQPIPGKRDARFKAFSEYVSRCMPGLPADTVMVVLTAISHFGQRWMLDSLQPLDFGFVKLVALPFRTNWKEIVAFKCKPNELPRILKLGANKCRPLLSAIGFEGVVTSPHNVGLAGTNNTRLRRLHWTIEAIPSADFEAVADNADRNRMLNGHASYVAFYEQTVEKLYNEIIEAMSHYTYKATSPWAEVRAISKTGLMAFLPISRHRVEVRGIRVDKLPQHIATPDSNFSAIADKQSDPVLVLHQAAQMRKMSALQSASNDVRNSDKHGNMGQFRPRGTIGLPVRHDGEVVDSGKPVLPCDTSG